MRRSSCGRGSSASDRVAVVLPTQTWQAYNFRDDDGDGRAGHLVRRRTATSSTSFRPFLNRGVPYRFRHYDLPFLHWLATDGEARRLPR